MNKLRSAYYMRTIRPHVWAIMERHPSNLDANVKPASDLDTVLEWVSAREHGGDRGARAYGMRATNDLNR